MVDASPLSDEEDDRPTLAMDAEEVSDAVPAFADWASRERALAGVAERYGGKLHWLADGSLLVTVDTSGAATDQAARAALCALEMRPLLAAIPVALVAGRAVVSRRMPMGEVIDRAVAMLAEHDAVLEATGERPAAGVARVDAIRLDEVVAGLLDPRFDVGGDRAGLFLRGKRDVAEARRTLLGRPSPCVGREREIASLLSVYDACFATGAARAVVITAAPGVGKSRLRFELMARLAQRGAQQRAAAGAGSMAFGSGVPEVWFARCDPMSAGSPFGMVVRMVQRAAGLLDAESPEVRQQKLRARVARHLPATERRRVTEFLGELCGVQFDDRDSVQLRAARRDAVLMGDQMRRAWEDFLRAEVAARPLLIILEDLQWGDLPTVQLIDAALRNLGDRPWMVLALGRPEIGDIFPDLWAGRAVTRVELDDLSRQGSEQLVRAVLGDDIDAATVARLAERAGGNAFYLEELIRAVVEGRGEMLPETVLAMVQARLETLPGAARLLLRAASVFGQIFWPGGLCTLVGEEADPATVAGALAELCEREVVVRRGEGRFPGEDEHIFRHALLREAAYSMLTDADRMLGHRLAGEWLERAGERDAALLAEHFERGDEPARATHWFRRAAEQALEGNDFDAACARADRGVALGASGALLGELRLVQAEAHGWRGQNAEAESCARVAMSTLPRGERAWFAAAGQAALASGRLGKPERLGEVAQMLSERGTAARPGGPEVVAAAHTVGQLLYAGRPDRAGPLLARLDAYERVPTGPVPSDPGDDLGSGVEGDPRVRGWVHSARATQALFIGDPGAYLKRRLSSANAFERAGDLRNACIQQVSVGYAYLELGAHLDAEAALRDALGAGERMGLSHACALARHNLGMALALLGRLQEARTLETEAATAFEAQGNRRLEGHARIYLAMILLMLHELDTADEEARLAVVVSAASPPGRAQALATLAQVKLARRSVGEALEAARDALELLERLGGLDEGEALVRLSHAEALAAAGQSDPARRAIAVAHRRLMERAARISDAEWRRSFLERVPENARTIQLARTWRVD
ncbi:MAG: AAA family ATPase [Polyangiaceae bacterium]